MRFWSGFGSGSPFGAMLGLKRIQNEVENQCKNQRQIDKQSKKIRFRAVWSVPGLGRRAMRPRALQDLPGTAQERSGATLGRPKSLQDRPEKHPESLQELPGRRWNTSRARSKRQAVREQFLRRILIVFALSLENS